VNSTSWELAFGNINIGPKHLGSTGKNSLIIYTEVFRGFPQLVETNPRIVTYKRPRRRWEDNIKMDLTEIGWDGMDWTDLVRDRDQWRALVNAARNFGFHKTLGSS
jgi:hypothetical protein